jgi:CRP/FNR family transcriptional regulator, cyclic AMP receptor protein
MKSTKQPVEPTPRPAFDVETYLESTGAARRIVKYKRGEVVFSQGDRNHDVKYVQKGAIKLSVLSRIGREAVVAMLAPGDFFGEGALAGQLVRIGTATAMVASTVLSIERDAMVRCCTTSHLLDRFISHMLARNIRIEADLVDQLFNSSEKRLARTLLLLARYGRSIQSARSRRSPRRRSPR